MNEITFLLNGALVCVPSSDPSLTLLDWLRERRGLYGTKEGCNEGDCGACTVMVTDGKGALAINSCILFLPQIHGKALRTVEGMSGPNGELHPVQNAMIKHHASQCGFCTPGFVVALVAAHTNRFRDHDVQLAGNLCRCTGYAPIIRAAVEAEDADVPAWLADDLSKLDSHLQKSNPDMPQTTDELATWYLANPDAILVNGATDIGLSVTKELKPLGKVAFLNHVKDLADITTINGADQFGAGVTISEFAAFMSAKHPGLSQMLNRFGSAQVRNSGTIGGNVANGSPIADTPPSLVALGTRLHLRKGDATREIALEDFYLEYGKQDRSAGEFVTAISIPHQPDRLKSYKLSKRFDQDISAVMGGFSIVVENGGVTAARIAFGGMAGTVKRASAVEAALVGKPWNIQTVEIAMDKFGDDFTPMSDARASAEYRLTISKNMLLRYFHEDQGTMASVLEVAT